MSGNDDRKQPGRPAKEADKKSKRRARQAKALRENLRRRKAQSRARKSAPAHPGGK